MPKEPSSTPQSSTLTSWWSTLPGLLTALGTLIAAITGLLVALKTNGYFDPSPKGSDVAAASEPYAVESVLKAKRQLVLDVRKAVDRAEEVSLRAREAARQGALAADKARKSVDSGYQVKKGDGWRYEGQWSENSAYGFGVMSYVGASASNGESFAGQFKAGMRIFGVFSYPPSISNGGEITGYEGEWAPHARVPRGDWNGFGITRHLDGSIYRGESLLSG